MSKETMTPPVTSVSRINWKQEETDIVVWKAGQMIDNGEAKFWGDAVLRAQQLVLGPHRQRPESSIKSGITGFRFRYGELIPLMKIKEEELRAAHETKHVEPASQPVTIEVETPEPDRRQELIGAIVGDFDDILLESISKIGDIFRRCLTEELKNVISFAMAEAVQDVARQSKDYATIAQYKPAKLRVVVVGYRHGDPGEFRQLFDSKLKLTFVDNGVSPIRLKNTAAMADYVVVNTDYVAHKATDQIKNHSGYIRVQGFTQVKDKLAELAAKE